MTETFDLGIVVPLYDKKATARQSVSRLLAQTVRPARVVVVDDGSTDGSPDELAGLEGVTLIRQANAGPSAARNRGVAELTTEWVAFADADNLWSLDRVERVRAALARHPEADWLAGSYWACWPDGRREALPPWQGGDGTFDYFDRAAGLPGLHCSETVVARRSLLGEIGGFNERLRCYEITQLYLRLAARRAVAGFVAAPTVEVFLDTPSSLYAEKRHAPAVLLAYAEELLAIRSGFARPPAYLTGLAADHLRECVYFACRRGEYAAARDVLRRYGAWLPAGARWKARARCLLARLRGQ